jgi:putative PIN family toxin of toxin-antitoxin system
VNVIIDTNVLISGIFWAGIPGKIISAWLDDKIVLIATMEIINEYIRVIEDLGRKFKTIDTSSLINLIMVKIQVHQDIIISESFCRDPDDDKFILCALATRVRYIITGDKDLLECTKVPHGLTILNPNDFYNQFLI